MQMVVAYELPFLLAIVAMLLKVNATAVAGAESPLLLADLVRWQAAEGALALAPSGILALVVAFFCTQAKLGFLPFDQAEAETEIIGGPLAEYSGPGLALFKITNAMMLLVMPVFLTTVFLGGIGLDADGRGGFHATTGGVIRFLVKILVLFLLIVLVKSTHARLRIDQVLRLYWGKLTVAAILAIGLALVGW
jgi:NADH-quinone oxidoreductase subunit H